MASLIHETKHCSPAQETIDNVSSQSTTETIG